VEFDYLDTPPMYRISDQFPYETFAYAIRGEVASCCDAGAVPTTSEWSLIVMTLLLLTSSTLVFGRRRSVVA
jgi:hypothetical protein